jgi:putative SOS response-associated peptidase YedK
VKPKTRYRFETGGPFVIAGVWDAWGKEEKVESVAMITTRANAVLEPIHDRMPVILHPSDLAMWLARIFHPELEIRNGAMALLVLG